MSSPLATGRLVRNKIAPPSQRSGLITREDLQRRLMDQSDTLVTLISAPAGYGKSSLMTSAYHQLISDGKNACWLSLDAYDNDIIRFARHLTAAINHSQITDAERDVVSHLGEYQGMAIGADVQFLAEELLEHLSSLRTVVHLFLDDLHLLEDGPALSLLGVIISSEHPNLRFVIASREVPSLPLARLRARGQLHELEASAVAFSAAEVRTFLKQSFGPELPEHQIEMLLEKTEGWPASLQMVSIAMKSAPDAHEFISRLSGADKDIADFLVEEVLAKQPQPMQRFLLGTSVLRSLNADLVNATLLGTDASALIEEAETRNLFLLRLDRERSWYRYHHLFGELLRRVLTERFPESVEGYRRRAGEWLAGHGRTVEAIEQAFAVRDQAWAGGLLESTCAELFASGQTAMLQHLADQLDERELQKLPGLQLELVWDSVIRWRFKHARELLNKAQKRLTSPQNPSALNPAESFDMQQLQMKSLHREGMLQAFTDRLLNAAHSSSEWLATYAHHDPYMEASCRTALWMCDRQRFVCDASAAEAEELRQLFNDAGAKFGTVFLDTVAGGVFHERGQVESAEMFFKSALDTAIRIQGEASSLAAMASAQLAMKRYWNNDVDEASTILVGLVGQPLEFGLLDSIIARQLTLARLARMNRNFADAHDALDVADELANRFDLPRLHTNVLSLRVQLHIEQGHIHYAQRLVEAHEEFREHRTLAPDGCVTMSKLLITLAYSRVALESGHYPDAIKLLRRWGTWILERQCVLSFVQIALLLARLLWRSGDVLAARRTMIDALMNARGNFSRVFLDEGQEVCSILQDLAQSNPELEAPWRGWLNYLLQEFGSDVDLPRVLPAAVTGVRLESLSDREMEIIRLTARNLAAQEVAHALGLTESTVKWYWQRIFEKLGVRRRKLAVRAAKERGLLV
ncbi:LuxR C-terminal-related transcriptional regulator [Pseudomonas hunanensis]|uniref:helix-turn-helix transcriptional regulator n=2 Tax=Pseudomonas TaxID=286 RepID=UPI003DA19534|nr:hypothetical protein [Pseudomonas sp. BN605]MDH4858535.1 hypothetical protein [Pseudomonas sp. BN505]NWL07985.1 hypothetical protein [Pseudomonas hunanensis]